MIKNAHSFKKNRTCWRMEPSQQYTDIMRATQINFRQMDKTSEVIKSFARLDNYKLKFNQPSFHRHNICQVELQEN